MMGHFCETPYCVTNPSSITNRVCFLLKILGEVTVCGQTLLGQIEVAFHSGFAELAVVEVEQFAAAQEVGAQEAEERGDIAQRIAGVEQGGEFRRGKAVAADAEAGGEFFQRAAPQGRPSRSRKPGSRARRSVRIQPNSARASPGRVRMRSVISS